MPTCARFEHMQTPDVAQCLKLISRMGCQRVSRTALELARAGPHDRGGGDEVEHHEDDRGHDAARVLGRGRGRPELDAWYIIVDNAAHQLGKAPEQLEVIVTTNMNGDILSDLTSALVGGLGFAPSANPSALIYPHPRRPRRRATGSGLLGAQPVVPGAQAA